MTLVIPHVWPPDPKLDPNLFPFNGLEKIMAAEGGRVQMNPGLFDEGTTDDQRDVAFAVVLLCPAVEFTLDLSDPAAATQYVTAIGADADEVGDIAGTDGGYRLGAAAGTLLDGDWIWGPAKRFRRRINTFIDDAHAYDEEGEYDPKPVKWPPPNLKVGRWHEASDFLNREP